MLILIVTSRKKALEEFVQGLSAKDGVEIKTVGTAEEALNLVKDRFPHLCIVDKNLPDSKPIPFLHDLMQVNAMVNTAVITSVSDEIFHEKTEGLGVMMKIPDPPSAKDAQKVMQVLQDFL